MSPLSLFRLTWLAEALTSVTVPVIRAGAAVWAAPAVDMKRGLVYAVTGDSYTDIDTDGDDAIVAMDLKTGAVKWRRQVSEHDNFVMGCGPTSASGNCPTPLGPDYDFGARPVL